ncbi:unnamed protein product [Didymodactylos carnosus]|uniref:NADAR domain-containing protein n=1 Tax=Didymodactylos carnosus TaxID=1234261 RepID=A0A815QBD1_9BILA|nr:unnamed protein product [Didymodactylos carnosus]CAF1460962.1 unnamed protein product [Didymodactylos carnosus]CAF3978024.1 unnamed protein product [Didymodactylos carnosus]CAF4331271.1 unnamed protein product [Didymodactylos carnosus]
MGGPGIIDGQPHTETDNFQKCSFKIKDIEYYSAENYFQAQKATNPQDHDRVRQSGCGADVWMAGSGIKLRPDWESVKVQVMYEGNKAKFDQNPNYAEQLKNSKGRVTFAVSSPFWNKWNGLIMERIRAEIRQNGKEDEETAKEIKAKMDKYKEEN